MNLEQKLRSKITEDSNGCWVWHGSKTSKGYGRFYTQGVCIWTHRLSYELFIGPIPEGLDIDHLCRVPACCNPTHLEPVTRQENTLRGTGPTAINAKKTTCPKGHLYDAVDSRGYRICRLCKAEVRKRVGLKRGQS